MKGHFFDMFLVGSGVTSSAVLASATAGTEVGGIAIPATILGPILVGMFTLIAFFLKQYYTAMVNVMTRQNIELHSINDKLSGFDKRLVIVETKVSEK